jgi:hypothetical protein
MSTNKLGLACLSLGYRSKELHFLQQSVWGMLQGEDVSPCVSCIESDLHQVAAFMNDCQRSMVTELLTQIRTRHEKLAPFVGRIGAETWEAAGKDLQVANELYPERLAADGASSGFKKLQHSDWANLRKLLNSIVNQDERLAAWFEIGERVAEVQWRLMGGVWKDEAYRRNYVLSAVNKLPSREADRVAPFFPGAYSHPDQLSDTFHGLSSFLEKRELDLTAKPKWDGTTLTYKGRSRTFRRQSTGVCVRILDQFEQSGWPASVEVCVPDANIKQAVYFFNQSGPVKLSMNKTFVHWSEKSD